MNILETERLVLRRMNVEDAEFIFELVNEPAFIRNIGDKGVRTLEDARNYILNRRRANCCRTFRLRSNYYRGPITTITRV